MRKLYFFAKGLCIKYLNHLMRFAFYGGILSFFIWFLNPWVFTLLTGEIPVPIWHEGRSKIEQYVGPSLPTWVPLKKVSKHLIHAIIVAEDGRFYEHAGLDFKEIMTSAQKNIEKGTYTRGGSTISQQVIKMALLSPEKSMLRKIREATSTLILERILSKDEILAWYLNLVDFGNGGFGVGLAAKIYFKKKPAQLSLNEAIHLALILPSPHKWSSGLKARRLSKFGQRRFTSILTRLLQNNYITRGQWEASLLSGDFGRPLPFNFTRRVRTE